MILDKLLEMVFGLLEKMIDILPEMPAWEWDLSRQGPIMEFFMPGILLMSEFMDVDTVMSNVLAVLGITMLLLGWSAFNWLFNKVRGSGG